MDRFSHGEIIEYTGYIPDCISKMTKNTLVKLELYKPYTIEKIMYDYNNVKFNDWIRLKEIYIYSWFPTKSFAPNKTFFKTKYGLL